MKIVQCSIVFIALASGHTTSVRGLRGIKFPFWKKCPFLTLGVPPIHQKSPLVFNDVVFTDAVFNDRVFKDALSSVSVFNNVVFNNAVFNSEDFNNEVNDEVLMRFSRLKYSGLRLRAQRLIEKPPKIDKDFDTLVHFYMYFPPFKIDLRLR